jgi:hypothetical protein
MWNFTQRMHFTDYIYYLNFGKGKGSCTLPVTRFLLISAELLLPLHSLILPLNRSGRPSVRASHFVPVTGILTTSSADNGSSVTAAGILGLDENILVRNCLLNTESKHTYTEHVLHSLSNYKCFSQCLSCLFESS